MLRGESGRQFRQDPFRLLDYTDFHRRGLVAHDAAQARQHGFADHVGQRELRSRMGGGELRCTFQGVARRGRKVGGSEEGKGRSHDEVSLFEVTDAVMRAAWSSAAKPTPGRTAGRRRLAGVADVR